MKRIAVFKRNGYYDVYTKTTHQKVYTNSYVELIKKLGVSIRCVSFIGNNVRELPDIIFNKNKN